MVFLGSSGMLEPLAPLGTKELTLGGCVKETIAEEIDTSAQLEVKRGKNSSVPNKVSSKDSAY